MLSQKKSYSFDKSRLKRTLHSGSYNTRNHKDSSASAETVLQKTDSVIFRPFLGLFYTCLHATFNQFASVLLKKLPYINPCQLTLVRHTGIFVGILPITVYHTDQVYGERKHRFILLMRGLFGATAFYFQFMAYSYLPLAEASIIMSTLPLVTAVIGRIVLKEPYGLLQSISLIMTLCGVLLILRLPELLLNRNGLHFDFTYVAGLVAAAGNVLLLSLSCVYIRKLKKIHFSVVMLYLGVVGMIENSVINGIFIPFVQIECGWNQILCILLGAFCFISNYFMTVALQVAPAGLAAVQKSSFDILIIMIFQIIFFNVYPDLYVICGASLVLVSLTIVGIRNLILVLRKTSQIRSHFSCLK